MAVTDRSSLKRLLLYVALAGMVALPGCSDRKKEGKEGADRNSSFNSSLKYQKADDVPFITDTRVLATIAENEKPAASGNTFTSHTPAPPKKTEVTSYQIVFSERGNSAAYKAEKSGKAVVVFNGKEFGKPFKEVGSIVISPDGKRCAYTAIDDGNIWHLVSDAKDDFMFHHIGEPVFSPDSRHIAFVASANDDWYVAIDNRQNLGGKFVFDQPVFSADGSKLAYIENLDDNNKKLYVTDLDFNIIRTMDSVAAPLVRSPDGKRVAVVIRKDNMKQVVQVRFDQPDVPIVGPLYDSVINPVYGPDGVSLSYSAVKGKNSYLVFNDKEERLSGTATIVQPTIMPDLKGVGVILAQDNTMYFQQAFVAGGKKENRYTRIEGLIYNKDGSQHAYAAMKGKGWLVVVNGVEGPLFDRVVPPLFSPDGNYLVYRARKDGKRFVVIADSAGKSIRQSPVYEQVFQPVYSPDGKVFGYGVKDGNKLTWMVDKL